MKRILSFVLFVAMSFALCLSFVSCVSFENENKIAYGKKYIYKYKDDDSDSEEHKVLIFNKDGTGTYETFHRYDSSIDEYDYTSSGTVSFIWEETSDGAIHMFKTDVKYNEDHSGDYEIGVISYPLYFSENMLYYSYVSGSQYFTDTKIYRYLLEGSELYEERYNKD